MNTFTCFSCGKEIPQDKDEPQNLIFDPYSNEMKETCSPCFYEYGKI